MPRHFGRRMRRLGHRLLPVQPKIAADQRRDDLDETAVGSVALQQLALEMHHRLIRQRAAPFRPDRYHPPNSIVLGGDCVAFVASEDGCNREETILAESAQPLRPGRRGLEKLSAHRFTWNLSYIPNRLRVSDLQSDLALVLVSSPE